MIVGSKYVFHTDNDSDVSSHKINQHICVLKILKEELRVSWSPIAWKGGTEALKVRNHDRCKNHKKYVSFPTSIIYFIEHVS